MKTGFILTICLSICLSNNSTSQRNFIIQLDDLLPEPKYSYNQICNVKTVKVFSRVLGFKRYYKIVSGNIFVGGIPGHGQIKAGGYLDQNAMSYLKLSKGKMVYIEVVLKKTANRPQVIFVSFIAD